MKKLMELIRSMSKRNGFVLVFILAVMLAGCSDTVSMPRPKGWPRIELPEHKWKVYENETCPFTFELPEMATPDSIRTDSCWMNFYFPKFNCRWHITYRNIPSSGKTRAAHFEEYNTLAYKHIQKSTRINPVPVNGPEGDGVMYELFGTIGVPAQFIYGNGEHLIMTSFYFPSAVNGDSLAPVIEFMKDDLRHMIETLKWK